YPDACLGSDGAGHDPADVVVVDGDRGRLLRARGHEKERHDERQAGCSDGEFRLSDPRHHLVLRKSCNRGEFAGKNTTNAEGRVTWWTTPSGRCTHCFSPACSCCCCGCSPGRPPPRKSVS